MRFKNSFLSNYLKYAPTPLALERTLECKILSKQEFKHPILDIGCGEGLFAYILFDEKIDVGIEPDKRELKRAIDYQMYKELIKCYGDKIPKPSNSFNTIFSNSVIEHIHDIEPVLKEAYRLLSDSGSFYITVPTNLFDKYSVIYQILSVLKLKMCAEKYRIFFNKFWRHYHYYSKGNWQKLFEKNGFRLVETTEYGSKKICIMNDFLTPFSLPSLLLKKIFNKWTLFPFIRFLITCPVWLTINNRSIERDIDIENGGLIFIHLKK